MFELLPDWINISLDWLRAIILWMGGIGIIAVICGLIVYWTRELTEKDDEQ